MSIRETRYHFGRLNLLAGEISDKKEFLLKGLRTDNIIKRINSLWGFFDIFELESEDGTFIHGFLVKYRPETSQEVALPETHRLDSVNIPNTVVAKSRFFLHVKSGLIIYHPISGQIDDLLFTDRFVELFQGSHGEFFVNAEIQMIEERFQLRELLRKFTSIKKIEVKLHPSNPSLSPIWHDIDEDLKRFGATGYQETFQSDAGGLKPAIIDDSRLDSKITMAEDGYGKATVTGVLDEEERVITTSENPVSTEVTESEEPKKILDQLSSTIKNIFSRFVPWE